VELRELGVAQVSGFSSIEFVAGPTSGLSNTSIGYLD
jgi:hypothetical protein